MSKVAIVLVPADARPRVLHRIHRITGLGMSEMAARTDAGRPIVECTLFYNDHDEVSGRLRDLLDALELEGVAPRLFELEDD